MKNLSELSTSELLNVIENNETLSNRLYELIEQWRHRPANHCRTCSITMLGRICTRPSNDKFY